MNIEAAEIIKLVFSEESKKGDKEVYKRIYKLLTLMSEKLKAVGMEGLLTRAQEEPTEANIARLEEELKYQINKDESFVNQLIELMQPSESAESYNPDAKGNNIQNIKNNSGTAINEVNGDVTINNDNRSVEKDD